MSLIKYIRTILLSKKRNTYEPTDVTYGGGDEYGANIHGVCIQVNQYVWDMIKILNQNGLYGFHFEAKLGKNKTIVILRHEHQKLLDKGKFLLKDAHEYSEIIFLTRLKKKKNSKTVWIILGLILFLTLGGWLLSSLYQKKIIFNFDTSKSFIKDNFINEKKEIHVEEVEIDIAKLKALKEIFDDKNNSIDPTTMKAMEITTSIISSMVSEEEKGKYSSKDFVKSFRGKSGIKFVLKNGNLSEDFNATVKDLNAYAMGFIQDNNLSLALQCYDKIVTKDNRTISKDELLMAFINKSSLEEQLGREGSQKESYYQLLEIIHSNGMENLEKYGLTEAFTWSKLSMLYKDLNETQLFKKALYKSEEIYKNLIFELKRAEKVNDKALSRSLNFLANFYMEVKKDFLLSIEIRKEALAIYKKTPKKFTLEYYKTLNSLGKSYLLNANISLAYKSYSEGKKLIKRRFNRNSLSSKIYLALSLRALGKVEVVNEKFISARKYYTDAQKIYSKLALKNKKYSEKNIEIEEAFAYLEWREGSSDISINRYKKVIRIYGQLNKKTPLKYNFKISKALNSLASVQIHTKNFIEAEIGLFRSIGVAKKIITLHNREAKILLSQSYTSLAYIALLEKNRQGALDYYKQSLMF